MEKRKLIPLSMMLLSSLCFAACNKPSLETTNVIATINNKNIVAEDFYNNSLYNETTAAYVYEILEKALIESAIPVTSAMRTKVENEVQKWDNKIKEDAKLNSTDYKEDLTKALEEQGVNSIDELIENKIYALQKEYAKDKFLKAQGESYKKQYIDANYLYHVGDINLPIATTSTTHTDLYNITISSPEAKDIYNAFKELVENEPYYSIANEYTSGGGNGDLGIITLNDADITNEMRYALIGYSSIVEGKYSSFNFPTNDYSMNLTNFYNSGMQAIPYSYIKGLYDLDPSKTSSETKYYESDSRMYYSGGGNSVSSSNKVYYRNILFNSLLNTKTPKFITVSQADVDAGARAVKMNVLLPYEDKQGYNTTPQEEYVLVNELGNPYVVFKDSKGLHILTINKTPFSEDLYDYYSSEVNSNDNYVSYAEFADGSQERLDEINTMAEKYIKREYGEETGNEKLLSFAIFKHYASQENNGDFKIVNENVKNMIEQYMNSSAELVDSKINSAFKGYYDTYSNLVWFRNLPEVEKEVPILSCLKKTSDNQYGCIYKYGEGFKVYAPASEGEGE